MQSRGSELWCGEADWDCSAGRRRAVAEQGSRRQLRKAGGVLLPEGGEKVAVWRVGRDLLCGKQHLKAEFEYGSQVVCSILFP